MTRLALLVLAFLSMPAWATTYYFASDPYTIRFPHSTCGTGTCADYPAGARVTGSFTTASPLAGSLPATEVTPLVTSYSFNDGVNTYSSADANARIFHFTVGTDATGKPSGATVHLQQWQAAAPHNAGNSRFNLLLVGSPTGGGTNVTCSTFGASVSNGVADVCTAYVGSTDTSQAMTALAGAWSVDVPIVVPPNVPTTYYIASGPYTTRFPHSTCGSGTCADYPLAARITGSFTTVLPLPANLPATEISGLISAYSFSDGVNTYASIDPNVRVGVFQVQTDAGGVPGLPQIMLQQWQAPAPHNAGNDRFNALRLDSQSGAGTNISCTGFGSTPAGAADACTAFTGSSDTSQAVSLLPLRTAIGAPPPLSLAPTTYAYSGTPFMTIVNHTTCAVGLCADYLASMRVTGTVTLVDRLPPNVNLTDVSGLVSAYGFADGVHTIAGTNPNARMLLFSVQTDPAGVPFGSQLVLEQWQAAGPHNAGDRLDLIGVAASGSSAGTNVLCPAAGAPSPINGVPDACASPTTSTDSSLATASGGAWAIAGAGTGSGAAPVPTLAAGLLVLLSTLLGAAGAGAVRRRA